MAQGGGNQDETREINFPVPWGFIAAKAWGDPCAAPVLLLHGIQDNAGTFDRLIPHLPRAFYYLCLDLPGHGLSSRMPKGTRLDFIEYVLSVNRVVLQLRWKTFCLIGHSLGGQLCQYYAALYPEQISKLIVLDAYGPQSFQMDDYLSYTRRKHEEVLHLETKLMEADPPSYTKELALERMTKNRRTFITREAAEALLPRNLKKGKNGFYFSPDQRLKLAVQMPVSHRQHMINYSKIQCPFLLVLTKDLYNTLELGDPEKFKHSLVGAFQGNPGFRMVLVEGAHDVHNMNPERIAPHVSPFLLAQKSAL